ncbi:hypothetical protein VTN00DRAFT_6215 [Thermoascus crustaceus]|uniref:uncharacterized protein n=1 Tax=Thermoascus crustaceus TaxID=5088 RepID=UPI00374469B3
MKRRITFIQGSEAPFDPSQSQLTKDALLIRALDAAREERATFGFNELPSELWQVLKQCHELHIRWASEKPYNAVAPFSSRVSPGLHVFLTPIATDQPLARLCPLLKKIFSDDLKCTSPETSFTVPAILSERFASTSSSQFHSLLPSLSNLVTYIQQKACRASDAECQNRAVSILSADYVDIDYDSISHALTISGYWSKSPQGDGWTEEIKKRELGADKVEVGLLSSEPATEPEELKVGGFLAVVRENDNLKPTLFSFPSRHHPLPHDDKSSYTVSFPSPTGLHPTLQISIPRSSLKPPPAPSDATCALHTYLTLPSYIFADKYQLSTTDPLFLKSHNLVSLRAVSGETDLEAPDWVVPRWGSNLLLEVATPDHYPTQSEDSGKDWDITIPLHLRYLRPSPSGNRTVSVPWPVVFWACTAEQGTKMGTNPFDRVNLGWDGLFGPRTMFYQLDPSPSSGNTTERGRLVEEITVPVLPMKDGEEGASQARTIEFGTVAVIVFGFVWVLWKLGLVVWSSGTGGSKRAAEKRNEKKDK